MANDAIINLAGAGRGATGFTSMAGATRARILSPAPDVKRQRATGDLMARKVVTAGVSSIRIAIESESIDDYIAALADIDANTIQELNLNVITTNASTPNKKITAKYAKVVAVGDSTFPPAEGSGNMPRWEITYELEKGSGVAKLSEAIVKTDGHATLT